MGGSSESSTLVHEMEMMQDTLLATGFDENEVIIKVVPGGEHNEQLWREEFGEAYVWLFLDGPNSIIDHQIEKSPFLFYQDGNLLFKPSAKANDQELYTIQLFSINGRQIINSKIRAFDSIEIPFGLSGVFVARLSGKGYAGSQKVLIFGK
jgi:alpha-glucosidase